MLIINNFLFGVLFLMKQNVRAFLISEGKTKTSPRTASHKTQACVNSGFFFILCRKLLILVISI